MQRPSKENNNFFDLQKLRKLETKKKYNKMIIS